MRRLLSIHLYKEGDFETIHSLFTLCFCFSQLSSVYKTNLLPVYYMWSVVYYLLGKSWGFCVHHTFLCDVSYLIFLLLLFSWPAEFQSHRPSFSTLW
jgi:hypothetical protein